MSTKRLSALLPLLTLLSASPAGALLCASDPVPAGTLLFVVTGKYSAASTPANPVADYTAPATTISITNVTAAPRIVNLVLHNDFGVPLVGWNALLTGYDVYTIDFRKIMEGYLLPTGPSTNSTTGRPYSPAGTTPYPAGPFVGGNSVPPQPAPAGVGTTANNTSSIFGLCTNPVYTTPYTVNPAAYLPRIPVYNRSYVFNGLRKSQAIAENSWWGNQPPYYIAPDWLRERTTSQPVFGYVTADVTDTCTFLFPEAAGYFDNVAQPFTQSYYANTPATGLLVQMGNSILGDWYMTGGTGGGQMFAQSGSALSIEMDNQDIINDDSYPKQIPNGASFYRYPIQVCLPAGQSDFDIRCNDVLTGSGTAQDFTGGAQNVFGSEYGEYNPSGDFREPLPSAFAFRWRTGDVQTKIRIWKEFPETYPFYGYTYIYSYYQYDYYAWDEEERVYLADNSCPVPPCEPLPVELNQFPLVVQEVDLAVLNLPTSVLTSGWMTLAFFGSNTYLMTVPGGYTLPFPNTFGTQCWVDVTYTAGGVTQTVPASPVGNFLCDGQTVTDGADGGLEWSGTNY